MKLTLTPQEIQTFGEDLSLIPEQLYQATPLDTNNRSPFTFYGVKKTAPFLGDNVEKDNYGVDKKGNNTCWPFTHEFGWTRVDDKINGKLQVFGKNDNCDTLYLITPVNKTTSTQK